MSSFASICCRLIRGTHFHGHRYKERDRGEERERSLNSPAWPLLFSSTTFLKSQIPLLSPPFNPWAVAMNQKANVSKEQNDRHRKVQICCSLHSWCRFLMLDLILCSGSNRAPSHRYLIPFPVIGSESIRSSFLSWSVCLDFGVVVICQKLIFPSSFAGLEVDLMRRWSLFLRSV